MNWFKILLLVMIGAGIVSNLAKSGGWKPKPLTPFWFTLDAVLGTLLFLGIWFWM